MQARAGLRRRGGRGARLPARARARRCWPPASAASASCSTRASASARPPTHNLALLRAPARVAGARACRCWSAGRASRTLGALTGRPVRRAPGGQRGGGAGGGAAGRAHRARARRGGDGRCAEGLAGAGGLLPAHERMHMPADRTLDGQSQQRHDEQNLFRHRRHPRHGRARRRSRPTSCCAWAMPWAACCAAATPRPTVLIGKDTRISGYMIESALEAGFASAGVDVLLSGPLPTPGVAYLTRALRLDLGVVISASHNPFADNGIKFFSARGEKLPDDWEREVEADAASSRRSGSTRPAWARRAGWTTRAAATSSSARAPCRSEPVAARHEDRRRRGPRRGLPRGARRVPRTRRRGGHHRLQPRRH